jgi:hypothetical protein
MTVVACLGMLGRCFAQAEAYPLGSMLLLGRTEEEILARKRAVLKYLLAVIRRRKNVIPYEAEQLQNLHAGIIKVTGQRGGKWTVRSIAILSNLPWLR